MKTKKNNIEGIRDTKKQFFLNVNNFEKQKKVNKESVSTKNSLHSKKKKKLFQQKIK